MADSFRSSLSANNPAQTRPKSSLTRLTDAQKHRVVSDSRISKDNKPTKAPKEKRVLKDVQEERKLTNENINASMPSASKHKGTFPNGSTALKERKVSEDISSRNRNRWKNHVPKDISVSIVTKDTKGSMANKVSRKDTNVKNKLSKDTKTAEEKSISRNFKICKGRQISKEEKPSPPSRVAMTTIPTQRRYTASSLRNSPKGPTDDKLSLSLGADNVMCYTRKEWVVSDSCIADLDVPKTSQYSEHLQTMSAPEMDALVVHNPYESNKKLMEGMIHQKVSRSKPESDLPPIASTPTKKPEWQTLAKPCQAAQTTDKHTRADRARSDQGMPQEKKDGSKAQSGKMRPNSTLEATRVGSVEKPKMPKKGDVSARKSTPVRHPREKISAEHLVMGSELVIAGRSTSKPARPESQQNPLARTLQRDSLRGQCKSDGAQQPEKASQQRRHGTPMKNTPLVRETAEPTETKESLPKPVLGRHRELGALQALPSRDGSHPQTAMKQQLKPQQKLKEQQPRQSYFEQKKEQQMQDRAADKLGSHVFYSAARAHHTHHRNSVKRQRELYSSQLDQQTQKAQAIIPYSETKCPASAPTGVSQQKSAEQEHEAELLQQMQYEQLKRHYHHQQMAIAQSRSLADQEIVLYPVSTTGSRGIQQLNGSSKSQSGKAVPVKELALCIPHPSTKEPRQERRSGCTSRRLPAVIVTPDKLPAIANKGEMPGTDDERHTDTPSLGMPTVLSSEKPTSRNDYVSQGCRMARNPRMPSLSALQDLEEIPEETNECGDLDTSLEEDSFTELNHSRINGSEIRSTWLDAGSVQNGNSCHLIDKEFPTWINANSQSPGFGKIQRWVMMDNSHRMAMRWSLTHSPLPPSPLVRDIKMPDLQTECECNLPLGNFPGRVPLSPNRSRYEESMPVSMTQNANNIRRLSGHRNPTEGRMPVTRTRSPPLQDRHSYGRSNLMYSDGNPRSTRGAIFRQPPFVPRLELGHLTSDREGPAWDSQVDRMESDNYKWGVYHKAVNKCTEILDEDDDSRLDRFVGHRRLAENILGQSGMNISLWRKDMEEQEEEEEEEDVYEAMETTL